MRIIYSTGHFDDSKIAMITLLLVLSQLDPLLAESVRRSIEDSEPYGIHPPEYAFEPNPPSQEHLLIHSNRPIVCNNKTEFECICMKPYTSKHQSKNYTTLTNTIPDCSLYIKTDELPIVDMRMKHVNTEALLYSGMSYEEYFKKRISSIVSHYCQHNTNECPGTELRMNQVSQDGLRNDEEDPEIDKSVLYAERDESEPLLNKENVVILRMDHLRGNTTRIMFVITKNDRVGGIVNENLIIDPIKVKYILASQVGPLSRVLGGIKIDSVRAAQLKRNRNVAVADFATPQQRQENMRDNSKLIKGLVIVCGFFLITYIIACVQCLRYFYKKRKNAREAKMAESGLAATIECKNYGTCENQRKPSRNGHVKREEQIPLTYEKIDESANEEPQPLTQRQVRNWFLCDSSQLPREPTIDQSIVDFDDSNGPNVPTTTPHPTDDSKYKDESPILTKKSVNPEKSVESITTPTPIFPPSNEFSDYVENQYNKSRASSSSPELNNTPPRSPQEDPWDEIPQTKMPVVLLQSETPDIPLVNNVSAEENYNKSKLRSESPTFARPRSRRGSRVDEEIGTLDLPELQPLSTEDPLEAPMKVPVPPEQIKSNVNEEDHWSSSEEGDVDVYYKMSDDEDVTREELDWKKAMTKAELEKISKEQGHPLPGNIQHNEKIPKKSETPPSTPIQTQGDSDSEEENENNGIIQNGVNEHDPDDDFVYERLREELSPQPPIVVDLDTTDLDLEPIKAMPPPPPGMYPDSPPESGIYNMHTQSQGLNSSDDEDSLR